MKTRTILALVLMAGSCLTALGQNNDRRYVAQGRAYHSDDTAVVNGQHGVGWIRAHFFDDWFLEMQGGGQLYYGTDDRKGAFMDRLTGNAEFHFGRRIFPMFGFRGGIGYGYARGFLSKDLLPNVNTGGDGQCGTDPVTGNPIGGYYYDYNDELYIQKWKYYYAGADLFLDLDIFKGAEHYDPYKPWSHILYGGVHTKFGLSEADIRNHRSEAHLGYICKYNFKSGLGLFLDARLSFIERLFDREWVSGVESSGFGLDQIANLHVGVLYKFHIRTEEERNEFRYRESHDTTALAVTHFTYVKMEETYTMSLIDTLLKYEQVNTPTPEMQKKIQDLLDSIEADNARRKRSLDGQPLDSILLNQLLPYEMVFFELDKWDILPSEEMKIDKMARIMKAYPNEKFILTGSADSKTGTVKRNIFLSHNRADIIYNKLVSEYGIPEEQLRREYLGGILDYKPFYLNRCTVIIMDHPVVQKAFNEMKQTGQAGGGEVKIDR